MRTFTQNLKAKNIKFPGGENEISGGGNTGGGDGSSGGGD